MESDQQSFETYYTWSQRWITLRPFLKRAGLVTWLVVDLGLLIFFLWSYVDYGVLHYFDDRALVGSIVDVANEQQLISAERAALPLKASDISILAIDATRVDFYTTLTNPNEDWYAAFRYQFSYGGKLTNVQEGFILPGQTGKVVMELGVGVEAIPRQAKLVLLSIDWVRVNHHAIEDYQTWQQQRLDFVVSDVVYDQRTDLGPGIAGRTTFTIKNHSVYAYWNPVFAVVLYRNQTPVGVTTMSLSSFGAGDVRSVSINWFGVAPSANETRVEPMIDIFDPSVYMPLQGERQPDVRERILD